MVFKLYERYSLEPIYNPVGKLKMALVKRFENAPSHTSLKRASKGNELTFRRSAMPFLALEIKLVRSTLEPEIAAISKISVLQSKPLLDSSCQDL